MLARAVGQRAAVPKRFAQSNVGVGGDLGSPPTRISGRFPLLRDMDLAGHSSH